MIERRNIVGRGGAGRGRGGGGGGANGRNFISNRNNYGGGGSGNGGYNGGGGNSVYRNGGGGGGYRNGRSNGNNQPTQWIGPKTVKELVVSWPVIEKPIKRRLVGSESHITYRDLCEKYGVYLHPIENTNYVFGEEHKVNSLFEEPILKDSPNHSESAGADVLLDSGSAAYDCVSVDCFIPSLATAVYEHIRKEKTFFRAQDKRDRLRVTLRGPRQELAERYKKLYDSLKLVFITGVALVSKSRTVSKDYDIDMERTLGRYLRLVRGPDECPVENIRNLGESCCASVELQDDENLETKKRVISEIQKIIRKQRHDYQAATIHMFGSSVSGLAEQTSDLDIACDMYDTGSLIPEVDESEVVRFLGKVLTRKYKFRGFQSIPHARCPIIKNEPNGSLVNQHIPLDSPFDLSFRLFGVYNSRLLRAYFINPDLRVAAVGIKAWSKQIGINNPRIGYLSSYAITLLFIHYCLTKNVVEFTDPDLLKDSVHIKAPLPDLIPVPVNSDDFSYRVGTLIGGFFKYYGASEFDYDNDVVTVRHNHSLTKKDLGWEEGCISPMIHPSKNIQNIHFAIMDPYEKLTDNDYPKGLNVCRGLQKLKFTYVKATFRTAWKELCENTNYPLVRCIEVAGNERYFHDVTPDDWDSLSSNEEDYSHLPCEGEVCPITGEVSTGIYPPPPDCDPPPYYSSIRCDSESDSDEELVAAPGDIDY